MWVNRRLVLYRAISLIALSSVCACANDKRHDRKEDEKASSQEIRQSKKGKKKKGKADAELQTLAVANTSEFASSDCDRSLWTHVYTPDRLKLVKSCVSVKGTIEESSPDDDGDQHFLIKLDSGQDEFINRTNVKKKNADLVGEIVCANPVSLRKAKSACRKFNNRIRPPVVGEHVTVTGSYVIDSHNGWAEIHPVSRIAVLAK